MSSLRLSSIWRYPVKSCRGEQLAQAVVEPCGLAGDRRWAIIDDQGACVTAREHPRLLLVTPSVDPASGAITLRAPGMPDVLAPVPGPADDAPLVPVKVSSSALVAALAAPEAGRWLSKVTGEDVRLVYLDDPARRPVNPDYSQPGDVVSFADGYPLLLAGEGSLAQLNEWIAAGPRAAEGPLPMTRFRPNLTVAGAAPFAEDGWRHVRVGEVTFRVAKLCDRCVLTTMHPDTAIQGKEPLATLASRRRADGKLWFGVNLIPDSPGHGGVIRAGDAVEVVR